MLFQQFYNWIKYKTLPPSFLFRNRLFIERDSKNRRIFLNFGNIARNQKWSTFYKINIQIEFYTKYIKYFIYVLFIFYFIYILFYNTSFFIFSPLTNLLLYNFWYTIDIFDYYTTFLLYFFWIIVLNFQNLLYIKLFPYLNEEKTQPFVDTLLEKQLNLLINNYTPHQNTKKPQYSTNELRWLFFSWLNTPMSESKYIIFENLFNNTARLTKFNHDKIYYYYYLFSLKSLISKVEFQKWDQNLNLKKLSRFSNNIYFNEILLYPHIDFYLPLFFFYKLNKEASNNFLFNCKSKQNPNLFILKNFKYYLNNQIKNQYNLNFNKNGLFYLHTNNSGDFLNYYINNLSTHTFLQATENHFNFINQSRWLYRYSILHRNSFKELFKYSQIKNNLSNISYNYNLTLYNAWNNFSKTDTFKKQFFSNDNLINFFQNHNNYSFNKIMNINFYENSYLWFLKKNYIFNSLNNNTYHSNYNFFKKNYNNKLDSLNLNCNSLTRTPLLNINSYNTWFLRSKIVSFNNNIIKYPYNEDFDLYIDYNFKTIFKNLDEYKFWLYILNTNNFFTKQTYYSYKFLNKNNCSQNLNTKFMPSKKNLIQNNFIWLSLKSVDRIYLKDFYLIFKK